MTAPRSRAKHLPDMDPDKETVLVIKGAISELPAGQREACLELAEHLRAQIKVAGVPVGPMAFALVGAEMQAGDLVAAQTRIPTG